MSSYNLYNIIEIGSTNTKSYSCENGRIITSNFQNIEFKKNYSIHHCIQDSDIDKLVEFIQTSFNNDAPIHIYGTSIFRQMNKQELESFKSALYRKISFYSFNVISAEEENLLTSYGAIDRVNTEENICVFIGGGGSTEISIYNKKQLVSLANTSIGVMDVLNQFPDLQNNTTDITINEVDNYIRTQLALPNEKAKYLVLAGGDFLLRYNNANYPVEVNTIFDSEIHPYIISYQNNRLYEDKYFHQISLTELRQTTPSTPNWWNGTRAMCAFTDVVAQAVEAKIIIPTNITMIYGIIAKISHSDSNTMFAM